MLIQGKLVLASFLIGTTPAGATGKGNSRQDVKDRQLYGAGTAGGEKDGGGKGGYHNFQFRRNDINGRNKNDKGGNKRGGDRISRAKVKKTMVAQSQQQEQQDNDGDDGGDDGGDDEDDDDEETESPSTSAPTDLPTYPTKRPTRRPTLIPTESPTDWNGDEWSGDGTDSPTDSPTDKPTRKPSRKPTYRPTKRPTRRPSKNPTPSPSESPTESPTDWNGDEWSGDEWSGDGTDSPTDSPSDKPTSKPTRKPTYRPSKRPTKRPTRRPTLIPTESPTDWNGDEWSGVGTDSPTDSPTDKPTEWKGDSHDRSGDEWSGDRTGAPTESPTRNKCKQVERHTCCNQPDGWSYEKKKFICEKLGCNVKKCDKRDIDSDSSSSWSGDEHDPTEPPTLSPVESVWSGDGFEPRVGSGDEWCLKAKMTPCNGDRYPDAIGYVSVCFDGELPETSGALEMYVKNLGESTTGGVHVHEGTSCDDAISQGGHYFKDEDPWFNTLNPDIAPTGTGYITNKAGTGRADYRFDQGYGYDDTVGKVVVVHDTMTDLDGDYARVACGVLEASPDPWSGDAWSGDGTNEPTESPTPDKCKQAERDACCSQSSEKSSYFQRKEVCDMLGCNLKKCGKRDASESSEDDLAWKGDEWSGDGDPTASPVWKGDEWGSASPTKKPTNDPTMDPTMDPTLDPTKKPSTKPTRKPTRNPTRKPTEDPTENPTENPTKKPSYRPTKNPTRNPTRRPTRNPTKNPTKNPTGSPTVSPTEWGGDDWTDPPTASPTEEWNGDAHEEVNDGNLDKCQSAEREVCCTQPTTLSLVDQKEICDLLGCNMKKCAKRNNVEDVSSPSDDSDSQDEPTDGGYGYGGSKPTENPTKKPTGGGYGYGGDGYKTTNNPSEKPTKKPTKKPTGSGYGGDDSNPGVTHDLSSMFDSSRDIISGGNDHYRRDVTEECKEKPANADNPNECVEVCKTTTKIYSGDTMLEVDTKMIQRRCE